MLPDHGSLLGLVLQALLYTLGGAVIVTSLLPTIRRPWWWVRIWDFPRPQNALIGTALVVSGLALLPGSPWTTAFLVVLGGVTAWQLWRVWPFTALAPVQMKDASRDDPTRRLRILVSNLEFTNQSAGAVTKVVRRLEPDLWLALEVTPWWRDRLRSLDRDFPDGTERPQDDAYGLLFRSRLPVEDLVVRDLLESGVPSVTARIRLRSGDWITFRGLHPRPPHTFQASSERDGELMVAARELAEVDGAVVVAGDFNDVPWSRACRTFQKIARLLDPRLGRGLHNSFNARSWISRWPLDHVFASEHFRLARMRAMEPVGSDHHPLLVDLSYEPEGAADQAPRALQEGDRSAAEALLKRGAGVS